MKIRPQIRAALLAALLAPLLTPPIAMSGCAGVETGNGRTGFTTATVKLALRTAAGTPGAPTTEDTAGTRFTFQTARAVVRYVELSLPDGRTCSTLDLTGLDSRIVCDPSGLRVQGPFVVDLLTGATTPSLADLSVPAGLYDRVDIRFDDDKGSVPSSDPLSEHTLLAEGTFDAGKGPQAFRLRLKFNEDARFERPGGFELTEDAPEEVLLWLDVAGWFQTLPLTECVAEGRFDEQGGTLLFEDSGGGCSDIENTLKKAIKESGQID